MSLVAGDIHKAIAAAQLRYYKLVLVAPCSLRDLREQGFRGSSSDDGDPPIAIGYLPREEISSRPDGWEEILATLGLVPINLGLFLSVSLLEVEPRFRPLEIQSQLAGLLREVEGDIVALDHTEILFQREFQLDPLRLLLQQSRNRMLLVQWPGVLAGDKLIYGETHHPEYRCYEKLDDVLICLNQGGKW